MYKSIIRGHPYLIPLLKTFREIINIILKVIVTSPEIMYK